MGAIDAHNLKDPEAVAMELISQLKGKIESMYSVETSDDPDETLETIAKKMNILKKGGAPDTRAMATRIVMDWQRGKITR